MKVQILSLLPYVESREPTEPREPLRVDVRLVHTNFLRPINTEPAKPRLVSIRDSVDLAGNRYSLQCNGCEAAPRAFA